MEGADGVAAGDIAGAAACDASGRETCGAGLDTCDTGREGGGVPEGAMMTCGGAADGVGRSAVEESRFVGTISLCMTGRGAGVTLGRCAGVTAGGVGHGDCAGWLCRSSM